MSWLKPVKSLIKNAISLENETGIGKYNLIWARYVFITYIVSLLVDLSIKYTPLKDVNPLNGFSLQLEGFNFSWMTFFVIINLPLCIVILLICSKLGLIDKNFKPKDD